MFDWSKAAKARFALTGSGPNHPYPTASGHVLSPHFFFLLPKSNGYITSRLPKRPIPSPAGKFSLRRRNFKKRRKSHILVNVAVDINLQEPMKQKKNPQQEQVTKIHLFYRLFLPCFAGEPAAASPPAKKRLSTSLREEDDDEPHLNLRSSIHHAEDGNVSDGDTPTSARPSKTMVIGTIFGARRGHMWFCVQHDRLSAKPYLLIELSVPTQQLVQEMRSGELIRLALESSAASSGKNPDLDSCPLRSVPVWTVSCNGRKLGFAARRKMTEQTRLLLKTMQSVTVGAGVIPAGPSTESVMYMRANYEHVVGNADSESFHLINPDRCLGSQELSVFLLRSQ